MNNKSPFSERYIQDKDAIRQVQADQPSKEGEIDSSHYATSKPKRITIRASIIHDKS